jgi:hypothetical protein
MFTGINGITHAEQGVCSLKNGCCLARSTQVPAMGGNNKSLTRELFWPPTAGKPVGYVKFHTL